MVDDDDSDESPSPEPRTDSRSALPREIRAWRRLHIVRCNETFSLFFLRESKYMEFELRSVDVQGAHEAGARPHPHGQGVGPLALILSPLFFINSKKFSVKFQVIPRTFISAQKYHGNSAKNNVSPC